MKHSIAFYCFSLFCTGHEQVVEILLNADIDINMTDDWGSTPLYAAAFHGNAQIFR